MNPDDVFNNVSFGSVISVSTMLKEKSEYQERFSYLWNTLISETR